MNFDISHITFRSLKGIIGLAAFFWIVLVVIVHHRLVIQHKQLDNNMASLRHRSEPLLTVNCDKITVNIRDKHCAKRLQYLTELEKLNKCFNMYGIHQNSSECSVLKYLVYVEKTCPEPESSYQAFSHLSAAKSKLLLLENGKLPIAKCRITLETLINKMEDCGRVCEWVKTRIQNHKSDWLASISELANQKEMEVDGDNIQPIKNEEKQKYAKRRRQTIILHMGLLTKEYGLNFGEGAFSGGPLGELVQWADLAATLELLGHEVILSWSQDRLKQLLKPRYDFGNDCNKAVMADIAFTDMYGLEQMKTTLGTLYNYRCKLRILDVYGTEPEFNHPRYKNKDSSSGTWGGKGLDPRQFYTHFPHSPDNSFLGFAVRTSDTLDNNDVIKGRVLLYGKRAKYLEGRGKLKFLDILHEFFDDIHATMETNMGDQQFLPEYVTNHGSLGQDEFRKLLKSSKIYVGLGFPVEGPAALEAVSNGVIFLNPKFLPPLDAHHGKPTSRRLTSQNPYAENFIGEPYVYTVDLNNFSEVRRVLNKIKNSERNQAKVNREFTHIGFIERVNSFIENQDFCNSQMEADIHTGMTWKRNTSLWPPKSSLRIKMSSDGESCASVCSRYNLTCERAFFPLINNDVQLNSIKQKCTVFETLPGYLQNDKRRTPIFANEVCHAPSYDSSTGICFIQSDPLLFSCACEQNKSVMRLCPCRTYAHEQVALCNGCT
uniref:alpha-1,6-mannosylglycoprotein 6-beta-N-acetylglucosaminyltransferase A-like n=1 Tax=Styela clava TaxID=7725 RepID=UPI00193A2603|nr:alpha-1,6-mannosylglycoprotein 6-beta-N-acetylglucosaminyltransferase A-like [Styela clava]